VVQSKSDSFFRFCRTSDENAPNFYKKKDVSYSYEVNHRGDKSVEAEKLT